jgi:hypothetical protein
VTRLQRAATRIGDGSAALAWRILSWPAAGEGWRACCGRTVWLGFCGWASWQIVDHQHATAALLAAGWLRAAWRTTPAAETEDHLEDQEPEDPDASPAAGPTTADLITAAHTLATGAGVHLAQLAQHLYCDPTATPQVRSLAAAAGIPITRGVRVPERGVSTGIRAVDLPPLPGPSLTAPVAVVAAGHGEQQQQQHGGFEILPDPDGNPVRWVVHPQEA